MEAILELFANFGVSWDRFLGQLFVFLILVVILRQFMYQPVLNMLEERRQRIAKGLSDAEAAAKAKAQSEKDATERLKEATSQAEALLDKAKASADTLKAEIQAQTQAELEKARNDQMAEIERLKQQMLDDVRKEVVSLVVATTTKVLQSELTNEQRKSVVKQASEALE